MEIQIVSPDAQLFSGEVESVTVPGKSGSFQILNNHAPIVSTLVSGKVIIKGNLKLNKDQKEKFIQEGNQAPRYQARDMRKLEQGHIHAKKV